MSDRAGTRIKRLLLLAVVAGAGLAMLAWSQPWFELSVVDGQALAEPVEARGDVAAPPLMALSLAGIASVAGLALAGPVLRRLLGALLVVLGGTAIGTSLLALGDPVRAVSRLVTELTGVAGVDGARGLVDPAAIEATAWPALGVAAGVLLAAAGLAVVVTAGRWPASGRRFEARVADADTGAPVDRVDQWDALSSGDDPTAQPRDARPTD